MAKRSTMWLIMGLCVVAFLGCTKGDNKLETYLDDPGLILRDPHYASYEEKAQQLESQYLKKKITYAEYLEQKKELDDQYTSEVNKRESILSGEQTGK